FIYYGVSFQYKIGKGIGPRKVYFTLIIGLTAVAVNHGFAYIYTLFDKCDKKRISCAAHSKHKSYDNEMNEYFKGYSQFKFGYFIKTKPGGLRLHVFLLFDIPRSIAIRSVKLAVLSRKILVVEVKPVVQQELV